MGPHRGAGDRIYGVATGSRVPLNQVGNALLGPHRERLNELALGVFHPHGPNVLWRVLAAKRLGAHLERYRTDCLSESGAGAEQDERHDQARRVKSHLKRTLLVWLSVGAGKPQPRYHFSKKCAWPSTGRNTRPGCKRRVIPTNRLSISNYRYVRISEVGGLAQRRLSCLCH